MKGQSGKLAYRGRNARRDANEPEIIKALEKIGCDVIQLDKPLDLLVGYRGKTWLIEVKMPKGSLEDAQDRFMHEWHGQAAVVRTAQQAIDVVTGRRTGARLIFN